MVRLCSMDDRGVMRKDSDAAKFCRSRPICPKSISAGAISLRQRAEKNHESYAQHEYITRGQVTRSLIEPEAVRVKFKMTPHR